MMWRERKVPLIVMAVLLLGNIFFFFTYRVHYTSRLSDLDTRMAEAQARLQQAQRVRMAAQQQLASYDKVRSDLQALYDERWSTQSQRFTALFEEVKHLAEASHFDPKTFSFTRTEEQNSKETTGIGTTVVSMSFTVQGTYEQIRRLINLLELSNQFVIIDGIGMSGQGADTKNLTMSIRLKTLFREPVAPDARRTTKQL